MAGRGPLPKEHTQRPRNEKRNAAGGAEVVRQLQIEPLSIDEATGDSNWPPKVRRWWNRWMTSPQFELFETTDLERLCLLAELVVRWFEDPRPGILAEIRANESLLNATYSDRLRNRISVIDEATAKESAEDAAFAAMVSSFYDDDEKGGDD